MALKHNFDLRLDWSWTGAGFFLLFVSGFWEDVNFFWLSK